MAKFWSGVKGSCPIRQQIDVPGFSFHHTGTIPGAGKDGCVMGTRGVVAEHSEGVVAKARAEVKRRWIVETRGKYEIVSGDSQPTNGVPLGVYLWLEPFNGNMANLNPSLGDPKEIIE